MRPDRAEAQLAQVKPLPAGPQLGALNDDEELPPDPVMTLMEPKLRSVSFDPHWGQEEGPLSEYSDMDIFTSKECPHSWHLKS